MMNGQQWNCSVAELSGVGQARREALEKAGIRTLGDLVSCYPRAYQNRGDIRTLAEIRASLETAPNTPYAAILTVASEPQYRVIRRGMSITKFRAFDDTGSCEILYFNAPYVKDNMHTGAVFRFFGRFSAEFKNRLQCTNPIYEAYTEDKPLREIVPVYPLTGNLKQNQMYRYTDEALRRCAGEITEYLPTEVLQGVGLPSRTFMLGALHRPASMEHLEAAKRRLVFEELFIRFLAMAHNNAVYKVPNSSPIRNTDASGFLAGLPYALTGAQKRCVTEIAADMAGAYAMNRILIGDVGSGKTIVAAYAAYLAIQNGYRCALLVPTEILANQHYADLEPLFAKFGIRCALLTGSVPKKQRSAILEGLCDDNLTIRTDETGVNGIGLIIGTHALLTEDVRIDSLGLVIIDEQHRFGVMQRAAILDKGRDCHCLVMSATPIPRTLSLVAYGGLDVSRIDELPKGRQRVDTFVVDSTYHERMLGFIRKQAAEGHQTYIVCPAVEENPEKSEKQSNDPDDMSNLSLYDEDSDTPALKAAVEYAKTLSEELPELEIGFVHGKMKAAEKESVMNRFCSGEMQVLVSTTVIEVGVNVPNATLMIVENAERFGLSQLHQLRGRVGRGSAKSYFILVTDSRNEDSMERLRVIKQNYDGYAIAEYDLMLRGPGDFVDKTGTRQHGEDRFRLAAGCRDVEFVELAAREAKRIADTDSEKKRYPLLWQRMENLLQGGSHTMN
ncbi:MAG: ATP-dependent DNA helicase RecG [Clostridia bacterium]|nr:ATP-dependent DNA helicase RecG [Clostridia bacterium]